MVVTVALSDGGEIGGGLVALANIGSGQSESVDP